MEKELITFNELAILTLLKFGQLNGVDMAILKDCIIDIAEVIVDDTCNEYFIMADGSIILEDSYVEQFYTNLDYNILEKMKGSKILEYLDNLDILEFVLRKIKLFGNGCVIKNDITNNFSSSQIPVLDLLYQRRYIRDCYQNDSVNGENYQAICLTKRGELYLFLIDNCEKISEFSKMLKDDGYDYLLIDAFLITQELEKGSVDEMLTVECFLDFCDNFDIHASSCNDEKGYSRERVPRRNFTLIT